MASSNMKYLLRTPDGKEYGPTDQDTLTRWAQAGRVTTECEVRNALMKEWHAPKEFEFLIPFIVEEDEGKKKSGKETTTQRAPHSLTKSGVFKCVPGNPLIRGLASLLDLIVLGLVAGTMMVVIYLAQQQEALTPENMEIAFSAATFILILFFLFYYTLGLGLKAQTIGQWFCGIMIIRTGGEPVLMGRALLWSVLYAFFGWTTLVCWMVIPGNRGLQDLLTGTRVVKITVRELA